MEVGLLLFSLILVANVDGQTIDGPDITKDIKTTTLSRIENPRVEKLSKACIKKRGKWIFKREALVDCFSLQVDGFFIRGAVEDRVEKPLFISVFDTVEEAKNFVRVFNRQIIKDRDWVTIFKPALVTFLQFPVPKNQISPSLFAENSEEIFIVSSVVASFEYWNVLNIPSGRYGIIDATKAPTEELMQIFKNEEIKPISLAYERRFVIFSQVGSRILNFKLPE